MAQKNARGPLDGLKVLDLTEHMAGPYCTMILADMGADVIKVERPGAGDSSRAMGDGSERNPYFRYINRNKKSLTLDYKSPRGKEIFLKLVAGTDVLVENYRPTVKRVASTSSPRAWAASCTSRVSRMVRPPPWACPSATSALACGECKASWPRSTSGSARARDSASSARSSRRRWLSLHGRARAGWPITWSPRAWARGIARTRPTSASRPRTAT